MGEPRIVGDESDAEVGQLQSDARFRRDAQQVRRLQIAVDDSAPVRVVERLADAERRLDRLLLRGRRTVREAAGEEARVRFLFRRCLCREPTAEESALLRDYVRRQRESFSTDAAAARAAAGEGPETGAGVVEAAAWSAAARVVMNLDEFITRE